MSCTNCETECYSCRMFKDILDNTIKSISRMLEIKDPYTAGHQKRVSLLASTISKQLGLDADRTEGIRIAGYLHDIGKIYIPTEFLSKPGSLTIEEWNLIKTHPKYGYNILKDIPFPWPVAKTVLQHHERMDGSGYPQGLTGEEILLEARIIALADVVEGMSYHRPYHPAKSIQVVIKELMEKKGSKYDEQIVDAYMKLYIAKEFSI